MKRVAKVVLFLAALVPLALLVRATLTGTLGVNPAETIRLETGRWALKFLLLSLAITPVRYTVSSWSDGSADLVPAAEFDHLTTRHRRTVSFCAALIRNTFLPNSAHVGQ